MSILTCRQKVLALVPEPMPREIWIPLPLLAYRRTPFWPEPPLRLGNTRSPFVRARSGAGPAVKPASGLLDDRTTWARERWRDPESAGRGAVVSEPECAQCCLVDRACRLNAVGLLEGAHRALRALPPDAIGCSCAITRVVKKPLDLAVVVPAEVYR